MLMSDMSYPSKEETKFMNVQGGEKKVMKKILSVALSTAMAFSMFASVAFGETATTPQAKFDALAAKGVLNGYPDGQAHLEKDLTRAEFAKIVTKLFDLTEVTNKLSYKDKGYTAKNWAVPYIEAVTAANLMQGKDTVKGIFDYNGKVTVEEVAAVLFRALKLETPTTTDNTASAWAKGYAQAVINKGLVAQNTNFKGNATRSLVVETAYAVSQLSAFPTIASAEALSPTSVVVTFSDKTTTTVTLTTALVEGVATPVTFTNNGHSYTTTVTLTAPKVVAVETPNAKQLVLKFNRAIDASSLISDDKVIADVLKVVTVTGTNNVTVAGANVSLNAGSTEATITFPGSEFLKGQYTVVVTDKVKTSTGTAFATYTNLLTVADTTAPTVVSATAVAKTTTNTVIVKVSEPVKKAGIIAYVNGVAATATVSDDTYDTITLTTGTLNSGSSYDVSLLNVTDYAGNVATPNPIKTTVAVTSDTAAPVISTVTVVSDKYVDLKFNKKVNYQSLVANVRLLNVYGDSQGTLSVVTVKDSDTIRLQVPAGFKVPDAGTFTGSLILGASVKDTLGNTLGTPVTQPITITKDTAAPTVTSAVYTSGKGLVVTFSENVKNTSDTILPTLINESTGQLVAGDFTGGVVDGAKVTYSKITGLTGNYTLRLPAAVVTDDSLSFNKFVAANITVTAATTTTTDSDRPTVTGVSYTEAGATEVVITVSVKDDKGLNVTSLRDLNSYTLSGKALPSTAYAVLTNTTGDSSTAPLSADVKIIIPKTSISETKVYNFVASGIVDVAGNGLALGFPKDMALTDGVAPTLTSATVSTGDSAVLVLNFSESLNAATVQREDFIFTINGTATTSTESKYTANVITAGAGNDAGKYYVTFTVNATGKVLDLNANDINTLVVKVSATADIKDTSANKITTGTEVTAK